LIAIKVNDGVGNYFQKNNLREGDTVCPMLFNMIVDMLAIMIERAENSRKIAGVVHILCMVGYLLKNILMTLSSLWNMTLKGIKS
jgi:hypothetical protein